MKCFKCGKRMKVANPRRKGDILYFRCPNCGAKHSLHKKVYDKIRKK